MGLARLALGVAEAGISLTRGPTPSELKTAAATTAQTPHFARKVSGLRAGYYRIRRLVMLPYLTGTSVSIDGITLAWGRCDAGYAPAEAHPLGNADSGGVLCGSRVGGTPSITAQAVLDIPCDVAVNISSADATSYDYYIQLVLSKPDTGVNETRIGLCTVGAVTDKGGILSEVVDNDLHWLAEASGYNPALEDPDSNAGTTPPLWFVEIETADGRLVQSIPTELGMQSYLMKRIDGGAQVLRAEAVVLTDDICNQLLGGSIQTGGGWASVGGAGDDPDYSVSSMMLELLVDPGDWLYGHADFPVAEARTAGWLKADTYNLQVALTDLGDGSATQDHRAENVTRAATQVLGTQIVATMPDTFGSIAHVWPAGDLKNTLTEKSPTATLADIGTGSKAVMGAIGVGLH